MERKIYVHGRLAHADDLLAAAVVIYAHPNDEFEVIRDDGQAKNAGPDDFVLDCGMVYDGENHFDHHQLKVDKEQGCECALTLVIKRFAPWILKDPMYSEFVESVRVLDTLGPNKFKKRYGTIRNVFQDASLQEFMENPTAEASRTARQFQRREYTGTMIPTYMEWIKNHSRTEGKALVFTANQWETFDVKKDRSGFNEAVNYVTDEGGQYVTVGYDPDDNCNVIFRTAAGEDAGVDLYKCNPEKLHFKHLGGFICKYFEQDPEEYRKLVAEAMPK